MGSWRRDGDDVEWQMFRGRGRRGWREDQEIAEAKQQYKEKSEEKTRKEDRVHQKELLIPIASHRRRGMG